MAFDLDRTARLARILVTEEEKLNILPRLENIMQMIDQLQAVDTKGILPMASP
ncbi:aspartyl/glutamyl-tRNA amidotransferase subunit C, partial [Propionibacterium freudenreichii]|uniref:Asp-tRNA(Asn)/Glu-tRNA(Gln) amidotransferase subunit GatC n=1 Tax=Propionibacterium freudenreichii TaxID=1744 RepID=UPI0038546007